MRHTRHATDRQRQRHFHPSVVELALNEGVPLSRNSDRLLLEHARLEELRKEGRVDPRALERAEKAAPLVCVIADGAFVTMFRVKRSVNRGR